MSRNGNRPTREVTLEREAKAWAMRSRGRTQDHIATELGLAQGTVSRILGRVEARELKRLSANVERIKARQNAQLEHMLEESVDAWHKSKQPRKRASSRSGGGSGDEVETHEVIERDGDPSHLYCAMTALGHQRQLWGLDVMAALPESATSIAELARDLLTRGASYEKRKAEGQQAGSTPGASTGDERGAPPV